MATVIPARLSGKKKKKINNQEEEGEKIKAQNTNEQRAGESEGMFIYIFACWALSKDTPPWLGLGKFYLRIRILHEVPKYKRKKEKLQNRNFTPSGLPESAASLEGKTGMRRRDRDHLAQRPRVRFLAPALPLRGTTWKVVKGQPPFKKMLQRM